MKFGVITFPGSNGDHDALKAIELGLKQPVEAIWYQDTNLDGFDCILIPGGFSYGDYLRAGAIARFAPIMDAVADFAKKGGPILGMCNGFQVLTEAGLLPGALLPNGSLQFRSQWVHVQVERSDTPWTSRIDDGTVLKLPIAHGGGRYFADPETLARLETNGQIVFRYTDANGNRVGEANPNGSLNGIAGICNEQRNVVGLMPHPERAFDAIIGGDDGINVLSSVLDAGIAAVAGR
jgi:phosphoribosylformylglycinamidine synthase